MVNPSLGMLNADAHGEGFGLNIQASPLQHLKNIACAVPCAKHHRLDRDTFPALQHQGLYQTPFPF
jgi:hypothetical protein